jgi:hypothetical protein
MAKMFSFVRNFDENSAKKWKFTSMGQAVTAQFDYLLFPLAPYQA